MGERGKRVLQVKFDSQLSWNFMGRRSVAMPGYWSIESWMRLLV